MQLELLGGKYGCKWNDLEEMDCLDNLPMSPMSTNGIRLLDQIRREYYFNKNSLLEPQVDQSGRLKEQKIIDENTDPAVGEKIQRSNRRKTMDIIKEELPLPKNISTVAELMVKLKLTAPAKPQKKTATRQLPPPSKLVRPTKLRTPRKTPSKYRLKLQQLHDKE